MSLVGSGDTTRKQYLSHRIHGFLYHYEAPILDFQRILVWENYIYSGVFMLIFHVCFAYVSYQSTHLFGFLFSFVMMLFWIDLWKHKIWPEIRAVPPNMDDEWGELNPRLLTLQEMCDILAENVLFANTLVQNILAVRSNSPRKFCVYVSGICVVAIFIGGRIPGAMIAYTFFMCLFLYPAIVYHKILDKSFSIIKPFVVQLHHSFQQKSSQTYQLSKYAPINPTQEDNSDDDISEFVPVLDERMAAVLATAVSDNSEHSETDEEDIVNGLAMCSNPHQSVSLSVSNRTNTGLNSLTDKFSLNLENSDDENDDLGIPTEMQPKPDKLSTETTTFASYNLPLSADLVANVMQSIVKDSISSFTKSPHTSSCHTEDTTPTGSAASTLSSDFEFLDFTNEEFD